MTTDRKRSTPRREPSWTGMARVVRPTLVAAIGGTGTTAAKAARTRIEHFVGAHHPYVAFRAFDTAFQDSREPRLVDNSEYVYLGGFNAQSVIADIVAGRAFPHWAKWLPPRLNFQQVAFGAGGIRPIGRLCYFYRRERVEAAIQEALTAITDSDSALRFHQKTGVRINLEAGLDIHIVGSVCGGTGSGMFLDLAFDLRRWAEQHTNREVTVTGHLVLPEAFRGKPVVMKALEANAYTALQELDRYMNASGEDPWTVEYAHNRREKSERAPFDHCYFLSGLQQGGTSDVDSLASSIGEAIMLLTLSQAGQKVLEGVINMAGQRKSTRDDDGRVCCYSSYGVLGLELPEELLGESLGPVLAAQLHSQLLQTLGEGDAGTPEEVQSFRERLRITDLHRIDELLPPVEPDLTSVRLVTGNDKRKVEAAKGELQRVLTEAHEIHRRERRRASQELLWDEDDLRRYLVDRTSLTLQRPGGLDRSLRYLRDCVAALQAFQTQMRERAQEAEALAEKNRAAAEALEQLSLANKDLATLMDKDLETWRESIRNRTLAAIYQAQLPRLERLASLIQQELVAPWSRIKGMLENLRLEVPRDEEAYYRSHRARASVGPLSWFRSALIQPNQQRLLHEVLRKLIEESRTWAVLQPKELNGRFYDLCTEAIHGYFRSEAGMSCDRLLAECYDHPKEKYKTEIAVLLARAQANWELHESYEMRDNKLEISSIGVRTDSTLYGSVRESYRHIVPVEQQRDDYIPIFRTEHGLSLKGLKSLSAYRESLLASIVEEQRYDFHFFNDRRWVTRLEFIAEDAEERHHLYLFSAAEMLGLLSRVDGADGRGYFLESREGQLGSYRREAFLAFREDDASKEKMVDRLKEHKSRDGAWRQRIERQIAKLEETLLRATLPGATVSDQYLSLDVYQLHAEIRALRDKLRIKDLGL